MAVDPLHPNIALPPAGTFLKLAELRNEGRAGSPFTLDDREYFQEWLVVTTHKDVDVVWVKQAPGLPLDYAFYNPMSDYFGGLQYDKDALLVDKRVRLLSEDSFYHWIVTCKYSTQLPPGGIPNTSEPWKSPIVIEWDSEPFTPVMEVDLEGKVFLNAAMQPFTPAPVEENARTIAVIKHHMRTFSVDDTEEWSYVTNEDSFLGKPPCTWLMLPPRTEPMQFGNSRYHKVTRRLRLGKKQLDGTYEKWDPVRILNAGTCRLQNDPALPNYREPVPIFRDGVQVTQPVLLDAEGQPLQAVMKAFAAVAGGAMVNQLTIEPTYMEFRRRRKKKFGDILKNADLPFN